MSFEFSGSQNGFSVKRVLNASFDLYDDRFIHLVGDDKSLSHLSTTAVCGVLLTHDWVPRFFSLMTVSNRAMLCRRTLRLAVSVI
jgi:hypothetical protein